MLEISKREDWNTLEDIGDEVDVIGQFSEYSGSTYICDAISEIADGAIPIYNGEIWENVSTIQEYIEQAMNEGLVDTSNADLTKIFQTGYYQYYTQLLYNNLEDMIFNFAVDALNNRITELEGLDIDEDELEEYLSGELNIDNNNTFDDIEEAVDSTINNIKADKGVEEDEDEE